MVDENSLEYKYGAECFKVVRLEREVAALKMELAQQTHNSAMADIARAFDDGFTAGSMGIVPKDIAWREWQRRQ